MFPRMFFLVTSRLFSAPGANLFGAGLENGRGNLFQPGLFAPGPDFCGQSVFADVRGPIGRSAENAIFDITDATFRALKIAFFSARLRHVQHEAAVGAVATVVAVSFIVISTLPLETLGREKKGTPRHKKFTRQVFWGEEDGFRGPQGPQPFIFLAEKYSPIRYCFRAISAMIFSAPSS